MVLHRPAMNLSASDRDPALQQALPAPPDLQGSAQEALFLDFDGTLVDIASHPDAIHVAAHLPDLLIGLSRMLDGRLALVSGRALADLDRFLGPLDIAMAGSHGGEFREAGASHAHPLADPLPAHVLTSLNAIAARLGGLLVEAKPYSAAIHYRGQPEAEAALRARTADLAQNAGLAIKRGKMVVELVMPGADKGSAVTRFMEMPQFDGARPIFVGDDITDEDAFKTVLNYEGGGILVGPMRQTAAQWRLDGVAQVHHWLKAALA